VSFAYAGHTLQKGCLALFIADPQPVFGRKDIEQAVQVGIWKAPQDPLKDPFGAADGIKPVVDYSDPHGPASLAQGSSSVVRETKFELMYLPIAAQSNVGKMTTANRACNATFAYRQELSE
jgi:hypothetical protein